LSANRRWAVIFETGSSTLKVYDFTSTTSTTISNSGGRVVTPSLYAGLTVASDNVNVANDGRALRIHNKIFHWSPTALTYVVDTLPSDVTTLFDPVFSFDFSTIVVNSGVWKYSAGAYTVDRVETYSPMKSMIKKDNNVLIYTLQETSSGSGKYNNTVQANVIVNGSLVKIADMTVQTTGTPKITVSPKLNTVFLVGNSFSDATKPIYMAKSINFATKTIKDILLPT
jgi:hypothetical protein